MKGKERCKILKDIRRQIAESNDIEFITSECKHKGDCLGTCPKCEAELRYLEKELEKRARLGKAVAVAGLAVSVTLASASCEPRTTAGDMLPEYGIGQNDGCEVSDGQLVVEHTMGDLPLPPPEWEGELVAAPSIGSITAENAMDVLGAFGRQLIRDEWREYVEELYEQYDEYRAENGDILRLHYDEDGVLMQVELIPLAETD